MQGREASLDSKFEQAAEAERLLVWAKRATQLCSAQKLNQLAAHYATFMDMEAFEQGDRNRRSDRSRQRSERSRK